MTPTPRGTRRTSFIATAAATYTTNAAAALLSLVNVIIVARALGPAGRGDVVFLITIAMLAANFGALGVQEANANLAGSEPRLARVLAANSLVLSLISGAMAAGIVAALVTVFPAVGGEAERALLWIALGSIPVLLLKTYLTLLVQADYRFAVTNLAWVLGPLTSVSANALLAVLGLITVGTAIAAWVAGQSLGCLLLVADVARRTGFGRPERQLARRSLGFGLKTHAGRVMALGNYRVDQWFLGAISGSRELGLYSVAVAWAEMLFYLPGVLVLIQRPDLVRASRSEAAVLATRVFRIALLLALPLTVLLVVAAPVLCVGVFGDEFGGSIDDLRILALGGFGIVALELLGSALTAQRKPMLTTGAVAVAFLVTLALDLLLVPRYGGLGAATATTVAWTVGCIVMAMVFRRVFRAQPRD